MKKKTLNTKKYKRHPYRENVSVCVKGECIKYFGEIVLPKIRYPRPHIKLMTVCIEGTDYSLPKIVAETFLEKPKKDVKHFAKCIDGDFSNTHPDNIEWVTRVITEETALKSAIKKSALLPWQANDCYEKYNKGTHTLSELGKLYGVSDMTIHRAIKRVKIIKKLEVK